MEILSSGIDMIHTEELRYIGTVIEGLEVLQPLAHADEEYG
jgi:hypothetical protein